MLLAGHPPAYRIHKGEGQPVGVFAPFLGAQDDALFQAATVALDPGDQLVLYTDGITEAYDGRGEQFGLARLDKVLENCAVGAGDLLRAVLGELEAFTGGRAAHDDRTLLVAKIT